MATTNPPPPVERVEIAWSENSAIGHCQIFSSLDAADAYVALALKTSPPPSLGYDKTFFVVLWSDGYRFEGRADITERDLGRRVLREHVARACRGKIARYGDGRFGVTADDATTAREILRRVDPPVFSDEETLPGSPD
jgi:two-component sensor histidine kinase